MKIVRDITELEGVRLAATIGFFDGVHGGHRFLIDELKRISMLYGLKSAIVTFEVPPRIVLNKDNGLKLLNTFEEKISHLSESGVDYCVVLDFTPQLANLTARQFIQNVLNDKMNVEVLLIGYDHRFGKDRREGFEEYVKYGEECEMKVIQAPQLKGDDERFSSSEIRRLLSEGEVSEAAKLLTYLYSVKGKVVSGHQVGRQIGYPTANVSIDNPMKIVPGKGIYAVKTRLADGKTYGGMLYIGKRPTLENGTDTSVEVNIFDFEGNLYEQEITIEFVEFIRGDEKFPSLEALKARLAKDEEEAKAILETQNK
jgi:riboflavin kinase/FMN adenylyltransferase